MNDSGNIQKILQDAPFEDHFDLNLYTVYDAKTAEFDRPLPFKSHGEAVRSFVMALKNKDTIIGQFPQDYALFHTASFSGQSGIIKPLPAPTEIISGLEAAKIGEKS